MKIRQLMKMGLWPISPCARFEGEEEPPGGGGGDGEAVALVDAEGNFQPNWFDQLDDDIKGEASLREVGNIKDMAKMYVKGQRHIGADKIALPGQNASDNDWSEFFSAVGKPKTSQDYPYKRPEGVPEDKRTDDLLNDAREKAHAMNWTTWQWKQYMKAEDARFIDDAKTQASTDETEAANAHKVLDKEWGMKKEDRVHRIGVFLDDHIKPAMGEEFVGKVMDEWGRNPMLYKLLWPMVKQTLEGEAEIAELSQKAPKEAQAELSELMASEEWDAWKDGTMARKNPAKADAFQRKYLELFEVINPPAKQAG